jgi:hypothetical protein
MCGDVEFGNDADAALVCVGNKLANLLLGIELPVGCQLLQPWSAAAFDAESLIVGKVKVQDVQFDRGHAVDIALEDFERDEVARHVNHQPSPKEAWMVVDL